MADRELNVFLDGVFMGVLTQSTSGNLGFAYDEEYRARADATPLSLSMPITRAQHSAKVVAPFLQGLLPDSAGRLEELAREFQTTSRNPFALLRFVGADVAGAVQILPSGVSPSDAGEREGDIERLDESALADLIADVAQNANTWGTREDGRWSLAGAQPKLALYRDELGWGIPRDATPTTHILKPAVPPFIEHDVNEFVTMHAARHLGLDVADAELMTTSRGDRVFVSARYDRVRIGGRWRRRHQEDFCQALSVTPALKYQSDGGPGFAAMAQLVDTFPHLNQRRRSQQALFDAMVFNVSVANTDAHAKNYSIILDAERAELAPLYDLGTHLPYPVTRPLASAMKVGDEYRLDRIGARDLVTVGRKLKISAGDAEAQVHAIRADIPEAFAAAAEHVDSANERAIADGIVSAVAEHVSGRGWSEGSSGRA